MDSAKAQLTLTPAAAKAGWDLTTFAYGFSSGYGVGSGYTIGPVGVAFTDSGTVLVSDIFGNVRVFPTDTDNQQAMNAPIAQNYGAGNSDSIVRTANGFYMPQENNDAVVQINSDGTFNQTIVTGLPNVSDLAVNPNNSHLFAASAYHNYIADVNPSQNKASMFLTLPKDFGASFCISTDGVTLYVAAIASYPDDLSGHILGYRLSDKTLVFDSGRLTAPRESALGAGSLMGYLFVTTNFGELFQIDVHTQVITLIAAGGTFGHDLTVDPNGSLMIAQSDRIMRLTPPVGGSFEAASIGLHPSTVAGSLTAIGIITLTTPSPTDLAVSLTSKDPSLASVPASITVPAGSIKATFAISTVAVASKTSPIYITATLNDISKSAPLTVRPIGAKSLVLSPNTIKGGSSVTGTVTLENVAAPGNITVTFTSNDTSVVPAPASVTIAAGKKSATFTVKTNAVTTNTTVTLTATANTITTQPPADLTVTP